MYRSKFDPKQPVSYSRLSKTGGGFCKFYYVTIACGLVLAYSFSNNTITHSDGKGGAYNKESQVDPTRNFLKRGTGTAALAAAASLKRAASRKTSGSGKIRHKPAVPKRSDMAVTGLKPTTKNFITTNAVDAILSVPSGPRRAPAANYLMKEDYGQVPAYLSQVKAEIATENEMIENFVQKQMGLQELAPVELVQMPEEERLELLDGLKSKWGIINGQYQLLCHNTFYERTRLLQKQRLEVEMDEIEADIKKLSAPPVLITP
jgi:hypothetical protein